MPPFRRWNRLILAPMLTVAGLIGCEPAGPTPESTTPTAARDEGSPRRHRPSPDVVAVPPDARDAFTSAMKRARETAAGARRRWANAPEEHRGRWSIKWAAPTTSGVVEYVWVQPVTWTVDRIEGVLRSSPRRELLCGRSLGEMVGLPADELVDWVCYLSDDSEAGRDAPRDAPRDGGFTMEVIDGLDD